MSRNYFSWASRPVWRMAGESSVIYTDSANPRMHGKGKLRKIKLLYGFLKGGESWVGTGRVSSLSVHFQLSHHPQIGTFLTHCRNTHRLASSCHKSDWQSQINTAGGDNLNFDNQSVRISHYIGSHTQALEEVRKYAKYRIMDWDSGAMRLYLLPYIE